MKRCFYLFFLTSLLLEEVVQPRKHSSQLFTVCLPEQGLEKSFDYKKVLKAFKKGMLSFFSITLPGSSTTVIPSSCDRGVDASSACPSGGSVTDASDVAGC